MDIKARHDFTLTLCRWAGEAIDHGRSPFRRAEAFPSLLTVSGRLAPPLVLWINRDSFMAGGVLFFPGQEAAEDAAAGRVCAQALGLRHFATWAPREIVFWEDQGETAHPLRSLAAPSADRASDFRSTFQLVLDEFKLLSVLGAVPADRLSPFYLANLCRSACQDAHLPLAEGFRIARGEARPPNRHGSSALAARHQGTLVLLRLLTLLLHDRLPPMIQPEGLARAMDFALDSLPAVLSAPLAAQDTEIELPPVAAIRFHHLFRRLLQLRFHVDRPRAARVVEILLEHEGRGLGARSINPAEGSGNLLLLNPDRVVMGSAVHEIATAPLLAFTALVRCLRDLPPAGQAGNVFALTETPAAGEIRGGWSEVGSPPPVNRRALPVHLRLAWPNRRFSLPPGTPRWIWEMLYLLGIAGPAARFELDTPGGWLTAPFGRPAIELLQEQFTIERLIRLPDQRLRIICCKADRPGTQTLLENPSCCRTMTWQRLRQRKSLLALALDLPDPLYSLLETTALILPDDKSQSISCARGLFHFSRSSLGRYLWAVVSGSRPLPPAGAMRLLVQQGCPLPNPDVLEHLERLQWPNDSTPPTRFLDAELTPWFGRPPVPTPPTESGKRKSPGRSNSRGEIKQTLLAKARTEGLPSFPEQYLYDYFRPELEEYSFSGPLSAGEEFFGRTVLYDPSGTVLQVDGWETVKALVLASFGPNRPVALPVDRRLTAAILERYLADLHSLRGILVREAHRRLTDSAAAERIVEQVWSELALPPWDALCEPN